MSQPRTRANFSLGTVFAAALILAGGYRGVFVPLSQIRVGHTEPATIVDCLGREFRGGSRFTPVAESKSGMHAIGQVFYSRESCTASIGSTVTILTGANPEANGSILSLAQFWFVPALVLAGTAVLVAGVLLSRTRRATSL